MSEKKKSLLEIVQERKMKQNPNSFKNIKHTTDKSKPAKVKQFKKIKQK